jgi:tetratricopeptide (TPR) repeat protein
MHLAAVEINRSLDNRRSVAINLNNVAWVYDKLADRRRALTNYQESLEIVRRVNDRRTIAVTLNNIAEIHADLGNYQKALEVHTEVLQLRRAVGDTDGEANTLNHLGTALAKLGERDKARDHFERALAIMEKARGPEHPNTATAINNLALLYQATGAYAKAD